MMKAILAAVFVSCFVLGCATRAGTHTQADIDAMCQAEAEVVGSGQEAKNSGMSRITFERAMAEFRQDPKFTKEQLAYAEHMIRRGYEGIAGSDVRIIELKAFDDCVVRNEGL